MMLITGASRFRYRSGRARLKHGSPVRVYNLGLTTVQAMRIFFAGWIRPAACALRGMVNVSSRFRPPLPERTSQQRKHLISLFRLCRG